MSDPPWRVDPQRRDLRRPEPARQGPHGLGSLSLQLLRQNPGRLRPRRQDPPRLGCYSNQGRQCRPPASSGGIPRRPEPEERTRRRPPRSPPRPTQLPDRPGSCRDRPARLPSRPGLLPQSAGLQTSRPGLRRDRQAVLPNKPGRRRHRGPGRLIRRGDLPLLTPRRHPDRGQGRGCNGPPRIGEDRRPPGPGPGHRLRPGMLRPGGRNAPSLPTNLLRPKADSPAMRKAVQAVRRDTAGAAPVRRGPAPMANRRVVGQPRRPRGSRSRPGSLWMVRSMFGVWPRSWSFQALRSSKS